MTQASILIVGAGPTGLTAALELTRRGFHPRIIDKEAGPAPESRALAVNPRSLAILEPVGLSSRLVEAGTHVRDLYLRSPDKLLLHVEFAGLPKPYDFMLILPQCETERLMETHLAELGVTVERRTRLTALSQQDGQITVEIEGPAGTRSEICPEIVIGADGAHSTVRGAIGQSFQGSAYENEWGLVDALVDTGLPLDGINVFDRAPDLVAMFPIKGKHVRLISDKAEILDHIPPDVRIETVYWQTSFRISHRLVERYQSSSVFLAGDAAHIHSPFGGRGMNLGIEDAAWLAWLIAEGETEGYNDARRPVAAQVLKTVDPTTRFMSSDGLWQTFLRRRIIPILGSFSFFQKRALPNVSASNTPFPPWLET